ncbi:MAG: tetratricopeptide repeat protein [bacterium]
MGKASRRKVDAPLDRPAAAGPRRAATSPSLPGGLGVWLWPAGVVLVGALLFANSFAVPFLFDDYFEITKNASVQVLQPLHTYFTRLRGLTALTFALNVRWGGAEPGSFHLVNVAIHLLNALLVYVLVLVTLRLPTFAGRYRERAPMLAGLVALVFVAHPLQTMAVSYIVQRAESLAATFYLLTVLAFVAAATRVEPAQRAAALVVAGVSGLLGVLCKETVASAPLAVALYWVCFLSGGVRLSWRRGALAAGLLAVPLVVGLVLARQYLLPEAIDPSVPRSWLFIPSAGFGAGISAWDYFLTQFGVVLWYLKLFILPTGQVFDYGWPLVDGLWRADVVLPLLALLAIAATGVLAFRRYALASFCIGWCFLTLAPTSSFVPLRDAAFEQRMYLPIVALAWLLVVGGYDVCVRLASRFHWRLDDVRRGALALLLVWVAGLGVATVVRNSVFADSLRLAQDTAAKVPRHWRAFSQLGDAFLDRKRVDEAIAAYETSLQLNPGQGAARVSLGSQYVQRKQYDDAARVLEPAAAMQEESVVAAAALQLASVYQARGDLPSAEQALLRAGRIRPQWGVVNRQLAALYSRQKRWAEAAQRYQKAIDTNPQQRAALSPPAAQAYLQAALAADVAPAVAQRQLAAALALQPGLTAARQWQAVLAARTFDWRRAEATLATLARERPNDAWVVESRRRVAEREPLSPPS